MKLNNSAPYGLNYQLQFSKQCVMILTSVQLQLHDGEINCILQYVEVLRDDAKSP